MTESPLPGSRCGLTAATDPDRKIVYVLGLAACRGSDVPPSYAAGTHSERFRRERTAVAFFELESDRSLVWSSECTWADEHRYRQRLTTLELVGYQVITVSASQLRTSMRSTDTVDDFPG